MTVTGTSETIQRVGLYRYRRIYRQPPPYVTRLPYYAVTTESNNPYSPPVGKAFGPTDRERQLCLNKCYERFHSKVRNLSGGNSQAGWLVSLIQYQQARTMFNTRCTNLLEYITKLERNFRRDRVRRTVKDWASFFLEMRFGWLPILSDIYSSLEILSGSPRSGTVRASASSPFSITMPPGSDWSTVIMVKGRLVTSMLADVEVSNPNLYLLNQLGLLNPAVALVDNIPWSFLVDWWVNLSQVASSFTDSYGLTISNGVTTEKYESDGYYGYYRAFNPPIYVDYHRYTTQEINRVQGIRGPALAMKPFTGLSMVRGLTALALTLQLLPSDPPKETRPRRKPRFYNWNRNPHS